MKVTLFLSKENWAKMLCEERDCNRYLITPDCFSLNRILIKTSGETSKHWKVIAVTNGELEDIELVRFFLGIPNNDDFFKIGKLPKTNCSLYPLVSIKPIITQYFKKDLRKQIARNGLKLT